MKYTYLLVNVLTILFPLAFSFERRIAYVRLWKYLIPALLLTSITFLVWDAYFTEWGYWGFNDRYILGWRISGLPIEEILFFFCIPYASIFIYRAVNTFYPETTLFDRWAHAITILVLLAVCSIGLFHLDKAYTALASCYAAAMLLLQLFVFRGRYMGKFYRFYLIHLIPFLIVNGILTGTGLSEPVVWYNDAEIVGIRIVSIPVEDTLYSLSLMLMNVTIFEWLQHRNTGNTPT